MATATDPPVTRTPTLGEARIPEGFPPERILLHPVPGTATEADLERVNDHEDRLCELIDGTLVEKTMGWKESMLACLLVHHLVRFVHPRRLGFVLGPDGPTRLEPLQVRLPDVAVYLFERCPGGKLPTDRAILSIVPDYAVEVLSEGNTRAEMDRKLREYLAAGVRLVWYADPRKVEVTVYDAVDRPTVLDATGSLDGGPVLPGFTLRVADWLGEFM